MVFPLLLVPQCQSQAYALLAWILALSVNVSFWYNFFTFMTGNIVFEKILQVIACRKKPPRKGSVFPQKWRWQLFPIFKILKLFFISSLFTKFLAFLHYPWSANLRDPSSKVPCRDWCDAENSQHHCGRCAEVGREDCHWKYEGEQNWEGKEGSL